MCMSCSTEHALDALVDCTLAMLRCPLIMFNGILTHFSKISTPINDSPDAIVACRRNLLHMKAEVEVHTQRSHGSPSSQVSHLRKALPRQIRLNKISVE